MIASVLMHQNGWTLHRFNGAKEFHDESESLGAANPPPAFSFLPTVWLVHRAHKLDSFPIIATILMPYPVLLRKEAIGFKNSTGRPRERTHTIPVGLFLRSNRSFASPRARSQRRAGPSPEEDIETCIFTNVGWVRRGDGETVTESALPHAPAGTEEQTELLDVLERGF